MPNLTEGLNKEQASAVMSESDRILMLAGAGTGKTRTLTHRLAHLNLNCRVGTSSIVAITFTRAASKEMKERLTHLIGESEAKKMICCTFHVLAVRILKEWGHRIGLDRNFTIYSQEDREEIIKAIISKMGFKTSAGKVLKVDDGFHNVGTPEFRVWEEYEWQLKRFNAVDLDALISKVNQLFTDHPDVAHYYNKMWKYIFIDEFQDTDKSQQMKFINLLNPVNLFVIGDWRQSIYGWRGARVENILEFTHTYPGAQVIELNKNYRSTKQIVAAANNLISHSEIQLGDELKALKDGEPILSGTVPDQEYETNGIVDLIIDRPEGKSFSDFAILARTNYQIETVYQALKAAKVPAMILSNSDDPLKKHDIKSLISYLNAIYNPKDDTNFKRVLSFPQPVITDLQSQQVEQISIDQSITFREAMKESNIEKLETFANRFDSLSEKVLSTDTAPQAFEILIDELDIVDHYEERNLQNRKADLDEAVQYLIYWQERQLSIGEECTVEAFLKWLKIRDIQEKLMDERDCVKLMTIHGSKGLEFDTVFLIGMNEDVFPSQNTHDMEEERRLAYVAITRAKSTLVISSTRKYVSSWGKEKEMLPSRFLQEMKRRNEHCLIV